MPDVDTRLTVFAMASHNQTRAPNFFPYEGTVTNAPFGRIPTNLFTGDPSADRYTRTQQMAVTNSKSISRTMRRSARTRALRMSR